MEGFLSVAYIAIKICIIFLIVYWLTKRGTKKTRAAKLPPVIDKEITTGSHIAMDKGKSMSKIDDINCKASFHKGISIVTTEGRAFRVEGMQAFELEIEHVARNPAEEEYADFITVTKTLDYDGVKYRNTNVFSAYDFLPLMTQQVCRPELPERRSLNKCEAVVIGGITLTSDSGKHFWIPIDFGEDDGWPEFYLARLEYFYCKFSILVMRTKDESQRAMQFYGKMSEAVLLSKYRKKEFSKELYFKIPASFILSKNTAVKRPLDENGDLATFEYYEANGPIKAQYSPWMESDFPVPMIWTECGVSAN